MPHQREKAKSLCPVEIIQAEIRSPEATGETEWRSQG